MCSDRIVLVKLKSLCIIPDTVSTEEPVSFLRVSEAGNFASSAASFIIRSIEGTSRDTIGFPSSGRQKLQKKNVSSNRPLGGVLN